MINKELLIKDPVYIIDRIDPKSKDSEDILDILWDLYDSDQFTHISNRILDWSDDNKDKSDKIVDHWLSLCGPSIHFFEHIFPIDYQCLQRLSYLSLGYVLETYLEGEPNILDLQALSIVRTVVDMVKGFKAIQLLYHQNPDNNIGELIDSLLQIGVSKGSVYEAVASEYDRISALFWVN